MNSQLSHQSFLLRLGLGGGILPLGPPHQPHQGGRESWGEKPFDCQHVDGVAPPGTWLCKEFLMELIKQSFCTRKFQYETEPYHPQVWFVCPRVSRAAAAKVAGLGNGDRNVDKISPKKFKLKPPREGGRWHNRLGQPGHHMPGINLKRFAFDVFMFLATFHLLTDKLVGN